MAQITGNPYYQYFIGLPGFSNESPYVPSLPVEFGSVLTMKKHKKHFLVDK